MAVPGELSVRCEVVTGAAAVCKGRRDGFCRTFLEEALWNRPCRIDLTIVNLKIHL